MARESKRILYDLEKLTNDQFPGYKDYSKEIENAVKLYKKTGKFPAPDTPEDNALSKLKEVLSAYLQADRNIGNIGRFEDAIHERSETYTKEAIRALIGNTGLRANHDLVESKGHIDLINETRWYYLAAEALGFVSAAILYESVPELTDTIKNYKNLTDIVKDSIPVLIGAATALGTIYTALKAHEKDKKLKERFNHLIYNVIPSLIQDIVNRPTSFTKK